MKQRIRRLQGSHWSNGLSPAQLLDIEVRNPNPANLAFALQVGERAPSLFQRGRIGIRGPVDLVEIDRIDRKAAEAVLHFAADRGGAQHFLHFTFCIPAQTALRSEERRVGKECRSRWS